MEWDVLTNRSLTDRHYSGRLSYSPRFVWRGLTKDAPIESLKHFRTRGEDMAIRNSLIGTTYASTGRGSLGSHRERTLRVLLVATSNQRRGAESFALEVADALRDRGFHVAVRSLMDAPHGENLPIRAIGPSTLGLTTLVRLRREMRGADVVIACGSRTLPASALAGIGAGVPVIYQNIGDPRYWAPGGFRRARVRAFLSRMSAVAALSEDAADALVGEFKVPASSVRVVPNGRDSEHFRPPRPAERAAARSALGVHEEESLVIVVGALAVEKRVHLAIRAVAAMPEEVRLLVVGDGPLGAELRREAQIIAPHRVQFLGQRTDLQPVLWAADAVALTSASEGVPGALIEAGMCGVPAMAVDVGYVRDVVVDGVTGHVSRSADVETLAAALARTLADMTALGTAARRHCKSRFDLDTVSDQWADLVCEVADGPGRHVRP